MTNFQFPISNQSASWRTKSNILAFNHLSLICHSSFDIWHYFRHSSLVIRHFKRLFFLTIIFFATPFVVHGATEFNSVVDPGGAGDYSSLYDWNFAVATDLTAATTQVFAGTRDNAPSDNATVYLCTSGNSYRGESATVVHATSSQILVESITNAVAEAATDYWNSSSTCGSGTKYFTLTDGGDSAIAIATCRTTNGAADTTAVTIDGWETSEDNYIKIWTDPDEPYRHQGKWDDSKYRLVVPNSSSRTLYIQEENVRIDGLQLYSTGPGGYDSFVVQTGAGENVYISNNISRVDNAGSDDKATLSFWSTPSGNAYIYNNIFYDALNSIGITFSGGVNINAYVYNNTIYNCSYGIAIEDENSSVVVAKNNIVQNCSDGYYGDFDNTSTNNVTDVSALDSAFGATAETGTTSSATANKLIDSTQNFLTTVKVGMIVKDSGTNYSYVTAIDSDTQLSLNDDIMSSSEAYTIYTNMFGSPTFEDEDNKNFHLDSSDTVAKNKGANLYADGSLAITTDIDNNARPNSATTFDIGADENIYKYYASVSPGATSAITSGTANNHTNHLTLSGITVTFELPLPDNVGVGDAIQYDSDNNGTIDSLMLIDKRYSSQKYRVKKNTGVAPAAMAVPDIDWGLFRAFTSLNDNVNTGDVNSGISGAVASQVLVASQNLVSIQTQFNSPCYANGTTVDSNADGIIEINGWTTSADSYLNIYTPTRSDEVGTSQRHSGVWTTSKYYIDNSANGGTAVMGIYDDNVRIDGLQVRNVQNQASNYDSLIFIDYSTVFTNADIRISNNILRSTIDNNITAPIGLNMGNGESSTGNIRIWNNIVYDVKSTGNNGIAIAFNLPASFSSYVYNNTVQNSNYGFVKNGSGDELLKNNIAQDCTDGYYVVTGSWNSASDYNLSDITGDAPGTNSRNNVSATFMDESGDDFHLAPNDTNAKNYGADLTNDFNLNFNTDIDSYGIANDTNLTRPYNTTWDIGADEVITPIYRSVAPDDDADNTIAALATGGSNPLNISGSTATFDSALPDNVGVGDALEYDDDNDGDIEADDSIVFIHERIDSTNYVIKKYDGTAPTIPSSADEIHWNINRSFTSLYYAVENGAPNQNIDANLIGQVDGNFPDLVSASEQVNVACYTNGTTADITAVEIDDWTTAPQNYVRIYTPYLTSEVGTSQRHRGTADSGYVFNASENWAPILGITNDYVRIDGLVITYSSNFTEALEYGGAGDFQFSNNIVYSTAVEKYYALQFANILNVGTNATVRIWNNIIYDMGTYPAIQAYNPTGTNLTFIIYNNTIINAGGIYGLSALSMSFNGELYLKNNIIQSAQSNYLINNGSYVSSNNISSDGTSPNASYRNQTIQFADSANDDFHLASTDAGAKDYGVDLSQDPLYPPSSLSPHYTDIDGAARPLSGSGLSYDIGADEASTPIYRSVGPSATSDLNTDSRTVSVSGNTAIFSGAMPDNVGVGDAIQYDSDGDSTVDAVAFITERTSNTTYTVASANGGTPPATETLDDFPANSVLDDFNRTSEGPPPSTDWENFGDNGLVVYDNAYVAGDVADGYNASLWQTNFGQNQEVYITQNSSWGYAAWLYLCYDHVNHNGYIFEIQWAGESYDGAIYRIDNNGWIQLGDDLVFENNVSDSFGLRYLGGVLTAYRKPAGGSWEEIGTREDATYNTGGQAGLALWDDDQALDNFGGGTISLTQRTANVYRAYTTLSNSEAGIENSGLSDTLQNFDDWTTGGAIGDDEAGRDIWTNNEQWNISAYANGTTADTNAVAIDGWTVAPTNYLRMYTPTATTEVGTSQRHSGKWDYGKYRLEVSTDDHSINLWTDYVRIDGLQIKSANHDYRSGIWVPWQGTVANGARMSNNIIQGVNATYARGIGFDVDDNDISSAFIWNNIIYNYNGTSGAGISVSVSVGSAYYIYNNTIQNAAIGVYATHYDATAKNNILKDCTTAMNGEFAAGTGYNATNNSSMGYTVSGGAIGDRLSQTFTFIDEAGKDFHLDPTDISARNLGADLSADASLPIADDIDGKTRIASAILTKTDNFNRSTLGSNWTTIHDYETPEISSNQVMVSSGIGGAAWNADSFGPNQYSQVKVNTLPANNSGDTGVYVRADLNGDETYYGCGVLIMSGQGVMVPFRAIDGSYPDWSAYNVNITLNAGDVIKAEHDGTNLNCYQNGILRTSVNDNAITGGAPGIYINGDNTPRLDDWQGGSYYSAFDIGADEAAKGVYYSVGQNTSDHSIGLGGNTCSTTGACTLMIDSGIATFNYAQTANNLGVGDKVTYNTTSVAYLSRKISTTQWYVVTATGKIPPDVASAQTMNSIAHTFASLSAAEDDADDFGYMNASDLAANDIQLNIPCYNDAGAADQTAVTVDGYTTGSNNFIKIYTPVDTNTEANTRQRHWGKWDDGKYRLYIDGGAGSPIQISDNYVKVDGIQAQVYSTPRGVINLMSGGNEINNNILKGVNTTNYSGISFVSEGSGVGNKVWNNIIYDFGIGIYQSSEDQNSQVYNNTVSSCTTGISGLWQNTLIAKNNIVQDCTTAWANSFHASSAYNNSDDGTHPGSNGQTGEVAFTDETNKDFHLALTDTMARNVGASLVTDDGLPFNTDIDGNGRSLWDIGADEGSVEMEATVMQSGGDYSSLSSWENGMKSDIAAPGTLVFAGTRTNAIADNATLYLCRSSVYQNLTATTVHATATQLLAEDISNPAFVFAASDIWYTNNTCNSSNYFTISAAGGNPASSVAKIDGEWSRTDTSAVAIYDWATSPTNYIKIYTTDAARHDGKWDENRYRIEATPHDMYWGVMSIWQSDVIVDGLQIKDNVTDDENYGVTFGGGENNKISNSIVWINNPSNQGYSHGILFNYVRGIDNFAWNNLVYGATGSGSSGFDLYTSYTTTLVAYNNTVVNCPVGFNNESGQDFVLKNNLSYDNTTDYSGTFHSSSTNNLAKDTTAPDYNTYYDSATVIFADAANSDFHLALTDDDAKDHGADLSADANLAFDDDADGDTRPVPAGGSWDIGADEMAVGIPIYYSVGQNVTTHETGAGDVDVDTTTRTATFTVAQTAVNMGVGDVIDYDADNKICYITEKVSTTVWKCQSITGGAPTDSGGNVVVNSVHHVFASLSAAITGSDDLLGTSNLTTGNYALNIPCYNDAGAADTVSATVGGYTTSANNYIKIYTPNDTTTEINQSQRHSGKWDTNKYRMEAAVLGLGVIDVNTLFVKIDGIQIYNTSNGSGYNIMLNQSASGFDTSISNCILKNAGAAAPRGIYAIASSYYGTNKVFNNIIYDMAGSGSGIYFLDNSSTNDYVYNNTLVGNNTGIYAMLGNVIAKNNIVKGSGNSNAYVGTFTSGTDYNATDGTDDIGQGTHNRISQTFSFVDETNKDFHLASTDTSAKGFGVSLMTDDRLPFSDDIDSQERTGNWSIGADEPRETEIQSSAQKVESITDGLVLYQSFDGAHMDWSQTSAEARDQSGSGNNGDVVGATNAIGKRGQALNFNGTSDWIRVEESTELDFDSDQTFSVSAWIKGDSGDTNPQLITSKASDYTPWTGWHFMLNQSCSGADSGKVSFALTNNGGTGDEICVRTTNDTQVYDGEWHQYTVTYDGSEDASGVTIYEDGVALAVTIVRDSLTGTILNNYPLAIGARDEGCPSGDSFFAGLMDEFRVYNRELSVDEIGDLYTLGQVKTNMSLTNKNTSGLVGMWSFDGADISGVNAYDRSGNNNTGTISGAVPAIGKKGQGLSFDGSDYVNTVDDPLDVTGDITVSFWMKPENGSTENIPISKYGGAANGWVIDLNDVPGIYFGGRSGVGNTWSDSGAATYTVGQWQHVVGMRSGSTWSIYINGVLGSSNGGDSGSLATNVTLQMGRESGSESLYFNGSLDEVRIYDRALSVDEVGDLYRLGQVKLKR